MTAKRDRRFMREALSLALQGIGVSSPNPTVGCVVTQDGRIVGRGFHDYALEDHAEVRAMREAGERARGAVVYVSLEPCTHFGRTPPCVDLLIQSRVRRVVVASEDPNPVVHGKGLERLRAAGLQVEVGLLEREAQRLIEPFARHVVSGQPLVVAKVGMTLDGRIGLPGRGRLYITSAEAAEFTQALRHRLDGVLVGVGSVLVDDPALTYRGTLPKGQPVVRAVLDSHLRTSPSARLFADRLAPVLLFCSHRHSRTRRRSLEKAGAEIVPVPHGKDGLALPHVLEELGKRGVLGLLVEGGGAVHWSFVSKGLVDKFYFVLAPTILGGVTGVPAVGGAGYSDLSRAPRFRITKVFRTGSDLVIEAYPRSSRSFISPWLRREVLPSGGRSGCRPSRKR